MNALHCRVWVQTYNEFWQSFKHKKFTKGANTIQEQLLIKFIHNKQYFKGKCNLAENHRFSPPNIRLANRASGTYEVVVWNKKYFYIPFACCHFFYQQRRKWRHFYVDLRDRCSCWIERKKITTSYSQVNLQNETRTVFIKSSFSRKIYCISARWQYFNFSFKETSLVLLHVTMIMSQKAGKTLC